MRPYDIGESTIDLDKLSYIDVLVSNLKDHSEDFFFIIVDGNSKIICHDIDKSLNIKDERDKLKAAWIGENELIILRVLCIKDFYLIDGETIDFHKDTEYEFINKHSYWRPYNHKGKVLSISNDNFIKHFKIIQDL